ncbi:hypothetical protein [Microbacterium sp. p3-SID336]|uniref:hypothetical protein n=1 Tax=Microbacterium sp. p3-SID336 TaxID=2916212 RepID=UPI0021A441BC|nr:hypothetical protein [Microbacterium sp. p3-SID336]MCT1479154.1 hypothetical protein [Microbacterium sp. p3-SID336]
MLWPFGTVWRPVRRRRRGTGVELRWLTARSWTQRWYPQGVDVGELRGRRSLVVSWFRQDRSGRHLASRITVVDLERSRHLDVMLATEGTDGRLEPARIHAGGLAWFGDRLFAAATREGIWEFDLARLRRVRGTEAHRLAGSRRRGGRATVLVAVRTRQHPVALRCSFLGRVFAADGTSLPRVLIGEYRSDESGVVAEFTVPTEPDGEFREERRFVPGIRHMQGAVRWGAQHFVSQSNLLRPGTLWAGEPEGMRRDRVPLPIGCEDLALDAEAQALWTLGEHPWRRVVRAVPFSALGLPTAPGGGSGPRT